MHIDNRFPRQIRECRDTSLLGDYRAETMKSWHTLRVDHIAGRSPRARTRARILQADIAPPARACLEGSSSDNEFIHCAFRSAERFYALFCTFPASDISAFAAHVRAPALLEHRRSVTRYAGFSEITCSLRRIRTLECTRVSDRILGALATRINGQRM